MTRLISLLFLFVSVPLVSTAQDIQYSKGTQQWAHQLAHNHCLYAEDFDSLRFDGDRVFLDKHGGYHVCMQTWLPKYLQEMHSLELRRQIGT